MTMDISFSDLPEPSQINYDILTQQNYRLVFPKAPKMQMFLQGFTLPSLSVGKVDIPTRVLDYNDIGEKLRFEPFDCNFLIDTGLKNYREIYNWMNRMVVQGTRIGETDNIILLINDVEIVRFYDCWPTNLGGIKFISNPQSVQPISCAVTFEYDYYEFLLKE